MMTKIMESSFIQIWICSKEFMRKQECKWWLINKGWHGTTIFISETKSLKPMIRSYVEPKSPNLQNAENYLQTGKALIKWTKSSYRRPIISSNWMECPYLDCSIRRFFECIINNTLIISQIKYLSLRISSFSLAFRRKYNFNANPLRRLTYYNSPKEPNSSDKKEEREKEKKYCNYKEKHIHKRGMYKNSFFISFYIYKNDARKMSHTKKWRHSTGPVVLQPHQNQDLGQGGPYPHSKRMPRPSHRCFRCEGGADLAAASSILGILYNFQSLRWSRQLRHQEAPSWRFSKPCTPQCNEVGLWHIPPPHTQMGHSCSDRRSLTWDSR